MMAELFHGDCLKVLKGMPDNSVDSIVTDPPYGLSFMSKKWDYDVPSVEVWHECLRVLKPGGHLLAFAGSRTYHRLVVNVEDAGFEIRDQIMWVYGSGFPKSHNIGHKAEEWQGWGTALKPAHEPIVVARKPLVGTVAANVLEHGTGGLNIDACRVQMEGKDGGTWGASNATIDHEGRMFNRSNNPEYRSQRHDAGRFPANFIHDGSEEVVSLFPDSSTTGKRTQRSHSKEKKINDHVHAFQRQRSDQEYTDSGSAARFFYCAKASRSERNAGLEAFDDGERTDYGGFHSEKGLVANGRNPENRLPVKNIHPTVKPIDLMRYLCRLVTPPEGVVLDPFMGSGTTGIGAKAEGFDFIGIEREEEYLRIAEARIAQGVVVEVVQQAIYKTLDEWL